MSHSLGNDKIYEELRGYFPPEYDLTPDELEKEIELENKKRELALAMMRVQNAGAAKSGKGIPRSSISSMHTNHDLPIIRTPAAPKKAPAPAKGELVVETEVYSYPSMPAISPLEEKESENLFDTAVIPVIPVNETPAESIDNVDDIIVVEEAQIPEAEVVTGNLLFDGFEPLNDLFDELEDTSSDDDEIEEDSEQISKARKPVSTLFDFLEIFAICITCIILVFSTFFRITKVSGESMEDTLYENEYLIVSDFLYEPKCGDIVVIQNTSLELELLKEPIVKRVIAVGGESVYISRDGTVEITRADGTTEILNKEHEYIKNETYNSMFGRTYTVPEGHVFVMGDNRNHSTDSRSDLVGVIDERCIFGKALVRALPLNAFTIFENPYKD